ncbi:MAG: hypothetical protein ACFBSE_11240, partial [Prochloraceae cyanobacterium]
MWRKLVRDEQLSVATSLNNLAELYRSLSLVALRAPAQEFLLCEKIMSKRIKTIKIYSNSISEGTIRKV